MAPMVARIMAKELNFTEEWEQQQLYEFNQLAKCYLLN
jgi:hypothetical protein